MGSITWSDKRAWDDGREEEDRRSGPAAQYKEDRAGEGVKEMEVTGEKCCGGNELTAPVEGLNEVEEEDEEMVRLLTVMRQRLQIHRSWK
ncbi:hypothetical protein RIF29_14830 [Crotalaria pallida]|uniref:Uncharacterized protein n=1 Tax=Crotalaria pallida TaxID=3830 RepID=A0AAN9FCC3_CROPI